MKRVLLLLSIAAFIGCSTPQQDEVLQTRMGNQCLEFGENGCLGKGIQEIGYTQTGEERVYISAQLYNCPLDGSGQLVFCDFDNPLLQGEIYGIQKNNSGNQPIKWFTNDYQQE